MPPVSSCCSKAIADRALAAGAGFLLLLFAHGAAVPQWQCYEVHISLRSGLVPLQARSFMLQWHPERSAGAQPCSAAACKADLPGLPAALSCRLAPMSPPSAASGSGKFSSATVGSAGLPGLPEPAADVSPGASSCKLGALHGMPAVAAAAVTSPPSCRYVPGAVCASPTAGSMTAGSEWGMSACSSRSRHSSRSRRCSLAPLLQSSSIAGLQAHAGSSCLTAPEPQRAAGEACGSPAAGDSVENAFVAAHDAQLNEDTDPTACYQSPPLLSPARSPPLPQLCSRPPSAAAAGINPQRCGSSSSSSSGGGNFSSGTQEGGSLSPRSSTGGARQGPTAATCEQQAKQQPAAADLFPSLAEWHSDSSFVFQPPPGMPQAPAAAGLNVQPVAGSEGFAQHQQQLLLALQQVLAGSAQPVLSSNVLQLQQEVLLLRQEVRCCFVTCDAWLSFACLWRIHQTCPIVPHTQVLLLRAQVSALIPLHSAAPLHCWTPLQPPAWPWQPVHVSVQQAQQAQQPQPSLQPSAVTPKQQQQDAQQPAELPEAAVAHSTAAAAGPNPLHAPSDSGRVAAASPDAAMQPQALPMAAEATPGPEHPGAPSNPAQQTAWGAAEAAIDRLIEEAERAASAACFYEGMDAAQPAWRPEQTAVHGESGAAVADWDAPSAGVAAVPGLEGTVASMAGSCPPAASSPGQQQEQEQQQVAAAAAAAAEGGSRMARDSEDEDEDSDDIDLLIKYALLPSGRLLGGGSRSSCHGCAEAHSPTRRRWRQAASSDDDDD